MVIKVTYNVTDVYVSETISATYINISYETPTGGGGGVWGTITGTLSNQTDLQNALNAKFDDPTGTTSQYLRGDGTLATFPTIPSGTVTSVGLTMPSAFSVAGSPVTSSGTLAVTGAGTASQYIRGDGQLANFPDNQGGGSSVNYYLNGSVTQGTFGGVTYYEMSKTPILGAGTNFTRTNGQGNGYIASFITDAGDPSLLNIPAGNWIVEFYFQANSNAGNPQFYAELYKVDASNNFTLVGSGSTNPEGITNGTTIDLYYTAIPVPQTSLLVTDRLAIRIFVITSGRTITLHTENSNLCEVITTLSTGLNALNGLTSQVQYFATGTSGTDFAISSATDTHTFNLPTASATNRGALSSADWSSFNNKISGTAAAGQVAYFTGATSQVGNNNLFYDATNVRLGVGTNTPQSNIQISENKNGITNLQISNTTPGLVSQAGIRLDSDASSGTMNIGKYSSASTSYLSIAATDGYLSNANFGDITLQNEVATGKIKFSSGAASTAQMTLTANGRLLLGQTTEGTQRLQVTGDTIMVGSGSTNATIALEIQNSSSGIISRFRNDGTLCNGGGVYSNLASTSTNGFVAVNPDGTFVSLISTDISVRFTDNRTPSNVGYSYWFSTIQYTNLTYTSGTGGFINVQRGYAPTSGTGVFNAMIFQNTINQTGGANGITRGLYVNPTLTAAADWRSIEWSNNTGWGLYGVGTSLNYLNGFLLLGSTTSSGERLQVTGTAKITGSTVIESTVTSTNNVLIVRNTGTTGFNTPCLALDSAYNNINSVCDIRLSSTNPRGLRIYASNDLLTATPIGAGFQMYANNSSFPGQMYFDSGANNSAALIFRTAITSGTITERMRIDASGNLTVDTNTLFVDATNNRLGVGTTSPQTNIQISDNKNGITSLRITNTTAGTGSQAGLRLDSDASSGTINMGKYSSTSTAYLSILPRDGYFSNANFGDMTLQSEVATGRIKFAAGAASTPQMTLFSTGNLGIGGGLTDSGQRLQVTGTANITSKLSLGAGTTSNAQINLASSTAPTSPNDGDIWFDGTNLKIQIGGLTRTFTLI